MEENWFIINDCISSFELGIIVTKLPPIQVEGCKFERTKIPGRGYLINIDEEEMEGTIRDVECYIDCSKWGIDTNYIIKCLRGTKEIRFSNQDEVYYKAYLNNKLVLEEIVKNGLIKMNLSFYCLPFCYEHVDKQFRELEKDDTIYNNGEITKPTIKITGTGNINLYIDEQKITITEIDKFIIIDSDLELIYKEKNDHEGHRVKMADFPILTEGKNKFTWDGNVTKVEVKPNRRYLA